MRDSASVGTIFALDDDRAERPPIDHEQMLLVQARCVLSPHACPARSGGTIYSVGSRCENVHCVQDRVRTIMDGISEACAQTASLFLPTKPFRARSCARPSSRGRPRSACSW